MATKKIDYRTGFRGAKLLELRTLSGLSMEEVAEKTGTDKSSISLWERGERRPHPGNLKKIADLFKVPVSVFFSLILFFSIAQAADLAQVAAAHIGRGETFADNTGPWVERYTKGQRVPWCAGFVSYCLRESGHDLPYTLRARDFVSRGVYGRLSGAPAHGEIVVFKRGAGAGHAAIVDRVLNPRKFWIIEGNHGPFPAKVKRSFVDLDKDSGREVLAFVQVE